MEGPGGGHKPSGDDHTHQVEEELALSAWPGLTHPQPSLNSGHSLNTEAVTAHAPGESDLTPVGPEPGNEGERFPKG